MPDQLPPCPLCASEYAYQSGPLLVCPMCAHEWAASGTQKDNAVQTPTQVKDAVGNILADGDSVTVVKTLKLKGAGEIKAGTKVRGIRLLETPVNGHDIDAKIPGIGQLYLKSSVVKKA